MEFRDLKKQYQVLKKDIDTALFDVVENCNFISGKQVKELEEKLAEYVGVKHCITCGNGTDALTMVMMAWDIKEGDAVFVPDFTFFTTGEIVSFEGATPIFVDVDPDTFNMDTKKLEETIQRVIEEGKLSPKAIIPVDLFGLPADFPAIEVIARKYNLLVVEDGAQGFGGMIGNKKACSFGDVATTSFFPAKPLGCYGDGGAIFTNDDSMAEYLKSIRVHGKGSNKYDNIRIGLNSRLDTIQAAILLPKLEAFKQYELTDINKAAKLYTEKLQGVVKTPIVPEGFYSSWAQYTIQLKDKEQRDGLQKVLKEQGIPSMVYYIQPTHSQQAFSDIKYYETCKVTDKLCDCVLSLPLHPYMNEETIDVIVKTIREYLLR
ncbi:MAG: DegT/DnrJ/EryC1/StrS family aminotransferase [Clostridiaceae bacterium]